MLLIVKPVYVTMIHCDGGKSNYRLFFNGKIEPYVCLYAWDAFLIGVCHLSEREEFLDNIFNLFFCSICLTYISVFIYDEHIAF